jgi:hypothetical protein
MAGTLTSPASGVTVRMYRHGFGDCFLLAFPTKGQGETCYMLIDCGVKYQSPGMNNLEAVAKNIEESTGGRIDVVVITHEHYDHLAGFDKRYASESKKIFDGIRFDEVWAAWIAELENEYEYNPRSLLKFQYKALMKAAERLKATGQEEYCSCAERVMGLIRDSVLSATAFEYVLGKGDLTRYLKPGQPPFLIEKVPQVRVYVLGPPEDPAYLKDMNVGKDSDVYELVHFAPDEDLIFAATILGSDREGLPDQWKSWPKNLRPFYKRQEISVDEARDPDSIEKKFKGLGLGKFFIENYGFDGVDGVCGEKWRRIDNDWLSAAEALALKLEHVVNNTSLAIAIEFVESGKVLLFSADAQMGNIRSWHELSWTVDGKKVETEDLLERTVLYKVGHHGSHNATLKNEGLEMMESSELVAMIPLTDKNETGVGYNGIPHQPLLERLHAKTRGRVIRSDHGLDEMRSNKPAALTEKAWNAFNKVTSETELYIDLTIEDK